MQAGPDNLRFVRVTAGFAQGFLCPDNPHFWREFRPINTEMGIILVVGGMIGYH